MISLLILLAGAYIGFSLAAAMVMATSPRHIPYLMLIWPSIFLRD